MPYSPLANGFLTGKYRRGQVQAAESARAGSVQRRYDREEAWRTLAVVEQIAQESDSTPAAIALAWLLAQPTVTAPILGGSFCPAVGNLPGVAHGDVEARSDGSPGCRLGLETGSMT
jgi:aryl-alcohol dehydrogenase-like predicted oxidoreductase